MSATSFLTTSWDFTQTYSSKLFRKVAVFFVAAVGLTAFNTLRSRLSPSAGPVAPSQPGYRAARS